MLRLALGNQRRWCPEPSSQGDHEVQRGKLHRETGLEPDREKMVRNIVESIHFGVSFGKLHENCHIFERWCPGCSLLQSQRQGVARSSPSFIVTKCFFECFGIQKKNINFQSGVLFWFKVLKF